MKGQKVTAEDVRRLRERSAANIMDCKKALLATDNDEDAAFEYIKKNYSGARKLITVR